MTLSSSVLRAASAALLLTLAACGPELTPDAAASRRAATQAQALEAPAASDVLVITEVMANPALADDAWGEWFEVYNRGAEPVQLRGWTITSANDGPVAIDGSVVVAPGAYVVLGVTELQSLNGGVPVAYGYGNGTIVLGNSNSDWLALSDPSGHEVDRVVMTQPSVTAASGRSRALLNVDCDNYEVQGAAWTSSTTAFLGTERGTPGQPNVTGTPPACPPPPATYPHDVRITELMPNPKGDDTKGEWLELHNTTSQSVDLRGWVLRSNNVNETHVIATSLVIPADGYVVLGNNKDMATNGGVPVSYQLPATGTYAFVLANTSDVVQLERPDGTVVDRVTYYAGVEDGKSRALFKPDSPYAQDAGGYAWMGADVGYGTAGNLGTPGVANPPPNPGPDLQLSATGPLPVGYTRSTVLRIKDAEGGLAAPPEGVVWSSSNEAVAAVDPRGYVSAVGPGTAFVTVTLPNGLKDSAFVEVVSADPTVPVTYLDPLAFGEPRDATPDDELLVRHPQYTLSYNAARGGPNWVSWSLNASHVGTVDRCNCFTPDPLLPAGVPVVEDADYRGSGYDRGHMVQSHNRSASVQENAPTYLLSNILPQAAENNQGPWAGFETFLEDLAVKSDKEVYVVSGGWYPAVPATLKNEGKVAIPDFTWKVAVVVGRGQGLADVTSAADLKVYAVWMPNRVGVDGPASADGIRNDPWTKYETTVAKVQARVGYDVLSLLPDELERVVEQNHAPVAVAGASRTRLPEGGAVDFSAAGSSDEDGETLGYHWTFSDGASAEGATVTHTFADDGAYTATLTVTDSYGEASRATVAVMVTNVAPQLAPLPSATLLPGETYAGFGAFADPGADEWTGSVTYGDGSAPSALTFVGQVFGLSHTYRAAGTYAVSVMVQDDDGGSGTASAAVVVLTQQQAIADLAAQVELQSLRVKLQAARRQLDAGNVTPAVNQLGAFVNEVRALERSGRLGGADADALASAAQRIVRSLGL